MWILLLVGLAGFSFTRSGPSGAKAELPASRAAAASASSERELSDHCWDRFESPFERRTGQRESLAPQAAEAAVVVHDGTPRKSKHRAMLAMKQAAAGKRAEPDTASDRWRTGVSRLKERLCTALPNTEIEAMVALVPDPVESGLSAQFYATLQGIQAGFEQDLREPADASMTPADAPWALRGMVRDESWLAWEDRRIPREQRGRSERCRLIVPSVMTFREDRPRVGAASDPPKMSIVLLVGDSPVTGPHRAALDRAIEAARQLSTGCTISGQEDADVRVLGPAFSGGAATLAAALAEARPMVRARVVSGTASAMHVPDFFDAPSSPAAGSQITFARTTPAEPDLMCALASYIEQAGSLLGRPRFALLSESGTAFGSSIAPHSDHCGAPALHVRFRVGIGAVRTKYEELDRRSGESAEETLAIARRTALDLTSEDERRALNIETEPVSRTTSARDLALTKALASIASMPIQYVVIQATDIADALFVARKVRDVVPDVRLVFFESHALLLHPSQRDTLVGSLVVSPYPLLGASPFVGSPRAPLAHAVFDNDSALGVAQAVAALRTSRVEAAAKRLPHLGGTRLPVWVSAIGRGGLMLLRPYDRQFGSVLGDAKPRRARAQPRQLEVQRGELRLPEDFQGPRLWQFVFVAVACLALFDWRLQAREQRQCQLEQGCDAPPPAGGSGKATDAEPHSDHQWDLAAIRVKLLIHQALRASLLWVVLAYMFLLMVMSADVLGGWAWLGLLPVLLLLPMPLGRSVQSMRAIYDFFPARGAAQSERGLFSFDGWVRMSACGGMLATTLGVLLAVGGAGCHLIPHLGAPTMLSGMPPQDGGDRLLFVLRSMDLASGVSPLAPLLLACACIYYYSLSRCKRLQTAYSVAQIAPNDHVRDGISTPLLAILYPDAPSTDPEDVSRSRRREGLLFDEARLVNAVAHPGVLNRTRAFSVLIAVIPLLFMLLLKQPSGLGSRAETWLLFGLLSICGVLLLLTLLYLFEYWSALEQVLKRIMEHPIGFSFRRTHPFARDALPDMIARDPDETLRLSASAQLAAVLAGGLPTSLPRPWRALLQGRKYDFEAHRSNALACDSNSWLESAGERGRGALDLHLASRVGAWLGRWFAASGAPRVQASVGRAEAISVLGVEVLTFACNGMRLLERAWSQIPRAASMQGMAPAPTGPTQPSTEPAPDAPPPSSRGAWAITDHAYLPTERAWLRDLESYVATIIALVIGRYVRQFKHFVYASTGCAVLLLATVSSYPFAPQRVLMTCIWLLMGATVSLTVLVYVGLDRNTLLSHISGSPLNRVTLSAAVILRAAIWVVLPLLSVLAAQYPDLVNAAHGIFEPLTRALR